MATARERYLNAVSPRAASSSEGESPSSAAANAEAAASAPPAPAAPSPRWSNRSSTATTKTSEMTSPAVTPRGAGRNAIASSPRAALSSSSANGRSPAVTSASASASSTAAGNATAAAAAASPAAPSSNSYPKPMSGRKPGGSTGPAKSRAVEARLSAAMAIYAGGGAAPMPSPTPGTPGGGPVSDDDYFTDDGLLDRAKVVSPRHQVDMVAGIRSPTNARNARLTGAAPPPTLGEIESHLLSDSHATTTTTTSANVASPGARSTLSTASGGHRARPMPENGMGGNGGGGRSHRKPGKKLGRGFFDESFEEAFPANDNLDAFNTSVDRGASNTNNNQNQNLQKGRAAPSPSAQRKADRGAASASGGDHQKALHDPFGTMPSLPTPTSSSSGGAAAAAGHDSTSTSVAARRRARAAATTGGLSIDTGVTSPTAAGHAADAGDATSPATMLDFALQGTPVAAAAAGGGGGADTGYPSDDEQEGVLGAVASPRSWKGASAAASSSKVDTSREGLIGSDDLSPSNAPTVMSDAEARLEEEEEERKRREAEEKKNRFLSKMILRVSCSNNNNNKETVYCMHRVIGI